LQESSHHAPRDGFEDDPPAEREGYFDEAVENHSNRNFTPAFDFATTQP
jgi:hypothetical protein